MYNLYKGTSSPFDITAISEGCDDELSKGTTFYMFWSNYVLFTTPLSVMDPIHHSCLIVYHCGRCAS